MRLLPSAVRHLIAGISSVFIFSGTAAAADITFWDDRRTGANAFNQVQTEAWFADAGELGLSWVRLTFAKWESRERDFLLGNADSYSGLVKEDLARLIEALDWAETQGLKVVIAPLSLPGARWRQNNDGKFDVRLWRDAAYWEQAEAYWRDLAEALADYPAVAAYNILNEPRPEPGLGVEEHTAPGNVSRFHDWYAEHRGTPADLHAFYRRVIAAIREVDDETPIMVDSGMYAQPGAFAYWPGPLADDKVLYAFHVYEPYEFTAGSNFRKKKGLTYPGEVPYGDGVYHWDKPQLARFLSPFFDWAEKHGIPAERIVASEFGCMRRNPGCREWLGDVIDLLDEKQVHWAFYSFREDEWDGYDYEVGSGNLPWTYWQAKERGEKPEIPRSNTPLFNAIRSRLQ